MTGGTAPYRYEISNAQSSGATISNNGLYTAGSDSSEKIDTITVTDQNGRGGESHCTNYREPGLMMNLGGVLIDPG